MIRKYPGIFLLIFVVGGIVIADLSQWPSWVFLLFALVSGLTGLLLLNRNSQVSAMICLGGALGGVVAVHFALTSYDLGNRHLAKQIDEDRVCHIFGRVSDWPELKANLTEVAVTVDSLGEEINRPVEGTVLLKITDTSTALQIGDRVEFHGRIYPLRVEDRSSGSFDYGRYLRMKGISGIVYLPTLLDVRIDRRYQYGFFALTDRLRAWITDCFKRNLPPDQAALASGFLIGETRDIPVHVYQQFRQSGTLHLLAVSGSNVALVLLVCVFLVRPFGLTRRRRGAVLLGLLLLFAVISYGQPSVIRASVMAGLVIVAGMLERRYDLNNIIALSAVIILLFDPGELFDVGFQLSYATAWGLIFIVPRLTVLFEKRQNTRWYRWVVFPVIISLIAQIVSTPLILLYFKQAPLLSVPANLVIVPLTGIAVVGVMAVAIADLIWPVLGLFVGSVVSLVLELLLRLVALFGAPDLPSLRIPAFTQAGFAVGATILIYVLVVLGAEAIASKKARRAVLWVLVLGCLAGVSLSLKSSHVKGEALRLTTIPGGIAAVRTQGGSKSGDLILLGVSAREYSISDRILCPWLRRLGVETIDKCFILEAEYRSLGDVFSLRDSLPISAFYLPQSMRQSVTDVLSHAGRGGLAAGTQYFSATDVPFSEQPGYYAGPNGLRLTTPKGTVWFARDVSAVQISPGGASSPAFVVLGEKVRDYRVGDSLKRAGVLGVICASLEQPSGRSEAVQLGSLRVSGPDFWKDLRATGELVMSLSDSLALIR